jgi:hypothetical protein
MRALTKVMKLDLLLFGRVPSGPFFALLQKEDARRPEAWSSGHGTEGPPAVIHAR